MLTIMLTAALLMQLAAGGLLLRLASNFSTRWPWYLGAGGLLLTSGLTGFSIFQELSSSSTLSFNVIIGIILLVVCTLILGGIYWGGQFLTSTLQSQQSLQEKSDLNQIIFENSPQLLALKNLDGQYVRVNQTFSRFLGKEPQAVEDQTVSDFFPRAQAAAFRERDQEAIQSGQAALEESEVLGAEGKKWLEITRTPIYDDKGEPEWLLVSARDVTGAKMRQMEIHQRSEILKVMLDAAGELTAELEPQALLDKTLSWAQRLGTAQGGLIALAEGEGNTLTIQSASQQINEHTGTVLKPDQDLARQVWRSGDSLTVNRYDQWEQSNPLFRETGFTAALGVPIKSGSGTAGALCVFRTGENCAFRECEQEALERLTQIFSHLWETSRAMQALQNVRSALEDKVKKKEDQFRHARILAAIAAHFIQTPVEKITESIDYALQTIGQLSGVDRVYLSTFSEGGHALNTIGEWSAEGVEPLNYHLGDLNLNGTTWWMSKLNRLETIHIPRPEELPSEAHQTAEFLKAHGIKSLTAIPLVSKRSLIGYLGFDSEKHEHDFSSMVLALHKITGDMFVNLLERKWSLEELNAARQKKDHQMTQLEQRNRQNRLIAEMGDLLLAARTADEAYPIISRYAQRLMPNTHGVLYLIEGRSESAERTLFWGEEQSLLEDGELSLNECWALRRGRLHLVVDVTADPVCAHVHEPLPESYLCTPLIAQGETMGLLHLRFNNEHRDPEHYQQLARMLAEHIALALSNLSLRDRLRSQAIRDPLTGLFNRRYMEATLERELRRAHRHGTTVGVMMFDVDHLKPINDTYGHDAGDALLKALGDLMIKMFRGEDVACRYGGDEFTIILPEATLSDIWGRAEQLREQFKHLNLEHNGENLGEVTMSIGVAAYPDHGHTVEELLQISDAAAYLAKSQGGDRVMIGQAGDEGA